MFCFEYKCQQKNWEYFQTLIVFLFQVELKILISCLCHNLGRALWVVSRNWVWASYSLLIYWIEPKMVKMLTVVEKHLTSKHKIRFSWRHVVNSRRIDRGPAILCYNSFMGSEPPKYLVIHEIIFLRNFVYFIFLLDQK